MKKKLNNNDDISSDTTDDGIDFCPNYKDNCNTCCKKRRFLLLFFLLLIPTPFLKIFRNRIYLSILLFLLVWIFLYNFPYLSKYLHTKPIYYEDLNKKNQIINLNNKDRKKFQKIFITIQQFTLTIAFICVYEYGFDRLKKTPLVFTELIALLGGFLNIYQRISSLVGTLLLKYLYYQKKKEYKKNRQIKLKLKNIEDKNECILIV
jgi:hypothetical protein